MSVGLLPLRGKGASARVLVDADLLEDLRGERWYLNSDDYVVRKGQGVPRRTVFLARQIVGLEYGDPREADHINRDRLDNRRANLRILRHAENCQNRSGLQGGTAACTGAPATDGGSPRCA